MINFKKILKLSRWKIAGLIIWAICLFSYVLYLGINSSLYTTNTNLIDFLKRIISLLNSTFYLLLFGGILVTYLIIGFIESLKNKN